MRHTFVKRITALMLAAALAVPVSAATQPVMEVQAATIRLADTSKAASVHQTLMKGKKVVITLKNGTSIFALKDAVMKQNGYGVVFTCTSRKVKGGRQYTISAKQSRSYRDKVNAKSADMQSAKASAVSSASADLADQLHKSLHAKKAFSFYTKGDPDKICKDLTPMVQAANRLGVIFKYDKDHMGGNYYKVTISKSNAECYYYMCGIMQEISDGFYIGQDLNEVFADDLAAFNADLLEAYTEELEEAKKMLGDGGAAIEPFKPYTLEEYLNYKFSKADRILFNSPSFNDASDILKLYAISMSNILNGSRITYDKKDIGRYWRGYTDHQVLKELYNYKARGTCGEFAIADYVVFSWLGIDVKICEDYGHAWVEGRAANSKEMIDFKFDYELELRGSDGKTGDFDKAGGSRECIN